MKVRFKQAFWAPALLASLAGCSGSDALLTKSGPTASQGPMGKIAVEDNRSAWQKMKDSVASTFGGPQQQTTKEADQVSLSKMQTPGPQLCVQLAQLHERSGNHAAAAEQYQRALKTDPNHLEALLGHARMNDRLGRFQQALPLYEEAVRKHPSSATAHNDLALCQTRQGNSAAAVATLTKAVNLQPKHPLYRNNLATVLVKLGRDQEAFGHLAAVHPPAVAHYNMGFLSRQAGKVDVARQHFAQAVQIDPSLAQAKLHLAQLDGAARPVLAQAPPTMGSAQPATATAPGSPR
jgi:Tfp pilus assembly protein PilF